MVIPAPCDDGAVSELYGGRRDQPPGSEPGFERSVGAQEIDVVIPAPHDDGAVSELHGGGVYRAPDIEPGFE